MALVTAVAEQFFFYSIDKNQRFFIHFFKKGTGPTF